MANMHETFLQVFDDASTILEAAVVVVSVGVGVGVDGAMCCNTVSLKPTNQHLPKSVGIGQGWYNVIGVPSSTVYDYSTMHILTKHIKCFMYALSFVLRYMFTYIAFIIFFLNSKSCFHYF